MSFIHRNFFAAPSWTILGANGRFSGLSIHIRELHHLIERILLQWHFKFLSAPPSTASTGCYPNTTSRQWVSYQESSRFLQPIKDDLALKMPGVYSLPCECGKVNIGQTGSSTETRVKEHH
jgi:hypothetical protein